MPKLMTIGSVARRLGQPEYRVDYATRTRGIQPAARAGQAGPFVSIRGSR